MTTGRALKNVAARLLLALQGAVLETNFLKPCKISKVKRHSMTFLFNGALNYNMNSKATLEVCCDDGSEWGGGRR